MAQKGSVLRLLENVGAACRECQDATLRNLPCRELECHEPWSFVSKKEKRTTDAQSARVQLTTDGLKVYLQAVEDAFGWNGVDYPMLVKRYGATLEGQRRYSPAQIYNGIQKEWVMGKPDPDQVSTSVIESHNLTMRLRNRWLTRLTNGYSKKVENHMHSVSLYFMAYDFVHVHHTLTKERKGLHTTPAMAAGVTDHVWKVGEIVQLLPGSN